MTGRTFSILAGCLAAGVAGAVGDVRASTPLEGEAIKQLITGRRIYLAAPIGGEFPLYYRADGNVDGSGEAVGLGRFLKPTDSGRWWVDGRNLCQKWQSWYQGRTTCFTLTDLGSNRLRWVQDNGDTGIARIGE